MSNTNTTATDINAPSNEIVTFAIYQLGGSVTAVHRHAIVNRCKGEVSAATVSQALAAMVQDGELTFDGVGYKLS